MLQKNPLLPPRPQRPVREHRPVGGRLTSAMRAFTSAEDYDATGILAGIDPCESRYWWVPELAEAADDADGSPQAATRSPTVADA